MQLIDICAAIQDGHSRVGNHAIQEASADGFLIEEIWEGVLGSSAEIIEDYPNDPRGPSCLIYCEVGGVPVHVVLSYPSIVGAARLGIPVLVFMITCYKPGGPKHAATWSSDFKRRLP